MGLAIVSRVTLVYFASSSVRIALYVHWL